MDGLYALRLPYAVAVDDRTNAHYYLAVSNGTNSFNDLVLDYQYGIGEWSKHDHIWANAFGLANDANTVRQVYFGNHKAMVYQLNDPDLNSDVMGEFGIVDAIGVKDISGIMTAATNTTMASELQVIFDASGDFTTATGAIVRITSGTGVDEERIVTAICSTGIVVTNAFTATPDTTSAYSIGDIDAYYTTKWYDVGSAPQNKNFAELFVWSSTDTSATMQVYYASDLSSTINSTDIVTTSSGSLWGTAIWGTDTWAGTSTSLNRVALNLSGRFIKFKFSEPSIDEPMDIMGYSIIYFPGDIF
jgi:hypothetical protein